MRFRRREAGRPSIGERPSRTLCAWPLTSAVTSAKKIWTCCVAVTSRACVSQCGFSLDDTNMAAHLHTRTATPHTHIHRRHNTHLLPGDICGGNDMPSMPSLERRRGRSFVWRQSGGQTSGYRLGATPPTKVTRAARTYYSTNALSGMGGGESSGGCHLCAMPWREGETTQATTRCCSATTAFWHNMTTLVNSGSFATAAHCHIPIYLLFTL